MKPAEIQLLEAMKISTMFLPLCWIAALMMTASLSAEPAMRDVATHDQLSERLRVANNKGPLVDLKPAQGPDPTKASTGGDLISRSDFLSYVGRATLVPKRAILHIPANMADRIKLQPGSKIQNWADFYAMNRSWITTVEVSRAQAEGKESLGEDLLKRIQKSTNVIVATHSAGPISVLPLKVPVQAPVATTTTSKP